MVFGALATVYHHPFNFDSNKGENLNRLDPRIHIQMRCMLEEGCLFLCLVSSEVIILIGWLIAPLRSVSMVWEGWSRWDVVIETDNTHTHRTVQTTVSTQHNTTEPTSSSSPDKIKNANANANKVIQFHLVLRPQQNILKTNLYLHNTLHESWAIQSLEMMLLEGCYYF